MPNIAPDYNAPYETSYHNQRQTLTLQTSMFNEKLSDFEWSFVKAFSTYTYSPHRSHDLDSAARSRHIQTADVLLSTKYDR